MPYVLFFYKFGFHKLQIIINVQHTLKSEEMRHKTAKYERIYNQIKELCIPIDNPYSRMATIIAILHNKIDYFFWTGFYNINEAIS
jgi:putative methionine-R-sulfoxide reductase with GAF domain